MPNINSPQTDHKPYLINLHPKKNVDTRLADRTSRLHPQHQSHPSTSSASHRTGSPAGSGNNNNNKKPTPSSKQQHGNETQPHHDMLLAAARQDLSEAQRSRTELVDKLSKTSAELEKLRRKTNADARRIEALVAERALLLTRVKDRDEELRGKAKLLDVCIHYFPTSFLFLFYPHSFFASFSFFFLLFFPAIYKLTYPPPPFLCSFSRTCKRSSYL